MLSQLTFCHLNTGCAQDGLTVRKHGIQHGIRHSIHALQSPKRVQAAKWILRKHRGGFK